MVVVDWQKRAASSEGSEARGRTRGTRLARTDLTEAGDDDGRVSLGVVSHQLTRALSDKLEIVG